MPIALWLIECAGSTAHVPADSGTAGGRGDGAHCWLLRLSITRGDLTVAPPLLVGRRYGRSPMPSGSRSWPDRERSPPRQVSKRDGRSLARARRSDHRQRAPEGQLPPRPSPVLRTLSLATERDAHLPPRHVERALACGRLQCAESDEQPVRFGSQRAQRRMRARDRAAMPEGKRDIGASHEAAILTTSLGDSHGQIHPAPGPERAGWFSGTVAPCSIE